MAGSITVRELLTVLGVNADTATVRDFDRAVNRTARTMNQAVSQTNQLSASVGGLIRSYLGFQAINIVARGVFEANKQFESLHASLQTTEGSVEAADEAFERITEFTTSTPFQLQEVTSGFIKLKNMGLDPSDRALRSYGNTAASMSKSLNDMVEAVADATTGEFERLKEFGIKASSQGNRVRFTFKGVTTEVGKNAKEIEEFLMRIGETDFAGAMDRQMDTLGGRVSNLQDAFFQFSISVGKAGLSGALNELLVLIIDTTNESDDLAVTLGQTLAGAVRMLTRTLRFLIEHADEVKIALEAMLLLMAAQRVQSFSASIVGLIQSLRALDAAATLPAIKLAAIAAAILIVILIIDDLIVFLRGGDSLIGRAFAHFGVGPKIIEDIRDRILTIVNQGIAFLSTVGRRFLAVFLSAVERVLPIAIGMVQKLVPVVMALATRLLPVLEKIVKAIVEIQIAIFEATVEVVSELIPAVAEVVKSVAIAITVLLPTIMDLARTIFGIVQELWPVVRGVIGLIFSAALDMIDQLLPLVMAIIDIAVPNIKLILRVTVEVFKAVLAVAVPVLKVIIANITTAVKFGLDVLDFLLTVWKWFVGIFVSIWETVSEPIIAVWEGIKATLLTILNTVIGIINSVINGVLSVINGIISEINNVVEEIPGVGKIETFDFQEIALTVPNQPSPVVTQTGDITVQVDGSTDMGPDELSRSVNDGLNQSLREAARFLGATG